MDDHQLKEEEHGSVGELSTVCSQIVLARIGRLDILWSVNKLARAVTQWTKSCDKCLVRLISYIHHPSEYRPYCHVGKYSTTMQIGFVSKLRLCWRHEDSKSTSGGILCIFRKSHVRANKLDVQETDISLTQLNRS